MAQKSLCKDALTAMHSSIRVLLVIGYVWPEPNSSAAGGHLLSLIRMFQAQGWIVHFASPAARGEHECNLDAEEIRTHEIVLNCGSFDSFVSDSLRYARHEAVKKGGSYQEADLLTEKAKREVAAIFRCDFSDLVSLLISRYAERGSELRRTPTFYFDWQLSPCAKLSKGGPPMLAK